MRAKLRQYLRLLLRSVAVILLTCSPFVRARANAQTTTVVVAVTGQGAPGGGNYTSLFLRGLNDSGQVLFQADLNGTSGGANDNAANFLATGNHVVQVVRESAAVPGGNGLFDDPRFGLPKLNNAGVVAFDAPLRQTSGGSSDNAGIFRSDGAGLTKIARKGDATPGVTGKLGTILSPVLNGAGQVAFKSFLTGTAGGFNDDEAIYRGAGGSLTQIARENQLSPDGISVYSGFFDPALNSAGQTAFYASLRGTPGGGNDNEAIYRGDGSVTTQIARKGQAAPDGNGVYGDYFSDPSINDAGQVAFSNLVTGTTGGSSDSSGVFRGSGGQLTQIARAGQAAPGNRFFTGLQLSLPKLNNVGQVVFNGYSVATPGGTGIQTGIYRGDGGPLTVIARQGQASPDGNGSFNSLSNYPALNDAGQVAFLASLSGTSGGANDNQGIFFFGDQSGLVRIARLGDSLLGSTITFLTFPSLGSSDADRHGLNSLGQVGYEFLLADGRRGIAVASVNPGVPIDANFDDDNDVDGSDFLAWQRGLGLTGEDATNLAGNADDDDDVDGDDLIAWMSKFGTVQSTGAALQAPEHSTRCMSWLGAIGMGIVGRSVRDRHSRRGDQL